MERVWCCIRWHVPPKPSPISHLERAGSSFCPWQRQRRRSGSARRQRQRQPSKRRRGAAGTPPCCHPRSPPPAAPPHPTPQVRRGSLGCWEGNVEAGRDWHPGLMPAMCSPAAAAASPGGTPAASTVHGRPLPSHDSFLDSLSKEERRIIGTTRASGLLQGCFVSLCQPAGNHVRLCTPDACRCAEPQVPRRP